ncbi:hypothetical protein ROZALSC1DRAFT_27254 [Rozella allomycis CSF55]|uniref:Uncharacterized protein n=1 Tax=Rozella allomycis (strain CSF55) TaxID=988480 RepID=A0A075AWL3_ROZAC|nr:hypothetical protein O9G_001914 [Rozella allomycis CSF55]RKP21325.1 hypothetical protein ROZALSC1DRAFT_27254 [Rozella allomycis CSF55]|eukprot:EPZ34612.1 hypothetical protein O9G_001914 [Rozella allomycis CSF55]
MKKEKNDLNHIPFAFRNAMKKMNGKSHLSSRTQQNDQKNKKKKKGQEEKLLIKPTETLHQFNERVEIQMQSKIATAAKSCRKISESRKAFLKKRSMKKSKEEVEIPKFIKLESELERKGQVKFGDVAQEPPTITIVPKEKLSLGKQRILNEERQRVVDLYRKQKALKISRASLRHNEREN